MVNLTPKDRALLRRGVDPWEVAGFYGLLKAFPKISPNILAVAAPVIAEIREDDGERLGKALASRLTEERLRRLLAHRDRESLARAMRSTVAMLGRRAPVTEVVETIAYWGDQRRRRLAQDYFMAKEKGDGD